MQTGALNMQDRKMQCWKMTDSNLPDLEIPDWNLTDWQCVFEFRRPRGKGG